MSVEHPSFPQCQFCLEDAIGVGYWDVEDDYDWGPLCVRHAREKSVDNEFDCFQRHHAESECPLKQVTRYVG